MEFHNNCGFHNYLHIYNIYIHIYTHNTYIKNPNGENLHWRWSKLIIRHRFKEQCDVSSSYHISILLDDALYLSTVNFGNVSGRRGMGGRS